MTVTTTWQRFDLTGTTGNGLSSLFLFIGGGSQITAGNPLYIWGAQMVLGNSAGTYDPSSKTGTSPSGTTVTLAPNGLLQAYAYDAFGNMTSSGNFNFAQAYTAANQLSGWQYDASGNLLVDAFNNTYTYDAESRITAISGSNAAAYVYDADGNRVEKSGGSTTDYVYFGGRQIARLSGGQWTDLIYGANGLLAEVPGTQNGAPVYRMLDHLGTQVGTVSATGTLLSATDYAPFGQTFTGGTQDPYQFTGKERDTESGNDYFEYRYYASSMGRWMSPDPGWFLAGHKGDPQTWNMYAYAGNNPLLYTDPFGLSKDCGGGGDKSVVCLVTSFWDWLTQPRGSGSTAGARGGGVGVGGGPGYPGGDFIPGVFMVPTHSWIERYPKGVSVLRNFWETQGPNNVKGKFGVREYITGFNPGGEDNNADGTHSDKDTIVNNSPTNQYDDTLGCPGGLNCQTGDFWQRFTVTMLWGLDKGKQLPVLIKVNGQLMKALHWQNNGRNPTTSLDFPGSSTLPGAAQSAPQ